MKIINSTHEDIDTIFELYEAGAAYQKKIAKKHWKGFERSLIEAEINESRQWKIVVNCQIACVFAITYNDPFIWQERDKDPSIYIHRIATSPAFRGNGFTKHIVEWVKQFAIEKGKQFIRMDTGSGNNKLNNYYINCGFSYLGITEYPVNGSMPEHYKEGSSSLFEIALPIDNHKYLPPGLPEPIDDGACDHLPGMQIPDISIRSTNGNTVSLRSIKGWMVIYCHPMTGVLQSKLPGGWDAIPGAIGCTQQACSFRDHFQELRMLNTKVYGLSTQSTAIQKNEKERIHLPFDLLSDGDLSFANSLKLPMHSADGMNLHKRVTLLFEDGIIRKYFYPVFPPDKNIHEVIKFLREAQTNKKQPGNKSLAKAQLNEC